MIDPYVYPNTDILKNKANIQDEDMLSNMEAEYTSLRLAELVVSESASCFSFEQLCKMHKYIFQDIYDWAGELRKINIEKAEDVLGGLSLDYSDYREIAKEANSVIDDMNSFPWGEVEFDEIVQHFSESMTRLWKVHPYREGNTRIIITFCCQFIESKGVYIDSELFKDNAHYMRASLVAANAIFEDLGDKRDISYLKRIVGDALRNGKEMKDRVSSILQAAGYEPSEERIHCVINWNRLERCEHTVEEIKEYFNEIKC